MEGKGIQAKIRLNRSHKIFEGHFPEIPVLPGVCLIQMVQELSSDLLEIPLKISAGSNIKFLTPINPNEHPEVDIKIETKPGDNDSVKISAVCNHESLIFMKFRGNFRQLHPA